MPSSFAYAFTAWTEPVIDKEILSYVVYQQEIAPGTGTVHYQGYCELRRRGGRGERPVELIKRSLGGDGRTHVSRARDPDAARDYCKKEETRAPGTAPFEWGEFRGGRGGGDQGRRTDLEDAAKLARESGADAVAAAYPSTFVKYHRGLEAIAASAISGRISSEDPPSCRVYYGTSGVGKTRSVFAEFGDDQVFSKDDSKWWDGYRGEKCILFDDWVGSSEISPVQLLRIMDRYPLRVQTKGGYVQMASTTVAIIFTSTVPHTAWYQNSIARWTEQAPAFARRVSVWKTFEDEVSSDAETEVAEEDEYVDADKDLHPIRREASYAAL